MISKYSTKTSIVVGGEICKDLGFRILEEQGLDNLPALIQTFEKDPMGYKVISDHGREPVYIGKGMVSRYVIFGRDESIEISPEAINEFFTVFKDVTKEADFYLRKKENKDIAWMMQFLKYENEENNAEDKNSL